MKTLIFHGSLRTLAPDNIQVEASTIAEALSALQQYKAFSPINGQRHTLLVEGFSTRDALYEKTDTDVINIYPVMAGSGAWARIIIGVVLIVVGVFTSWTGVGAGLISAGIGMVLGGVLQLLMPQPSATSINSDKSRYLSGTKNTVAIGTRIPIIYGTRKAFGHYLSFDIDSGDFNQTPASWYASTFTNFGELTSASAPATGEYEPQLADGPNTHYPTTYLHGEDNP